MNRLQKLSEQLAVNLTAGEQKKAIKITDNRTGRTIEVPVQTSRESDFINATLLGGLKDTDG